MRAEDMLEAVKACGIPEEGFDKAPRTPLHKRSPLKTLFE